MVVAGFRHVGGGETGLKLSEIQPNQSWDFGNAQAVGFLPGTDSIQLFDANGKAGIALSYACTDYIQNNCYDYDHEGGWFDSDDIMNWDFSKPLDYELNFGEGYVIKAGDGAGVVPSVTFNGEVKKGVTEIPCKPFMFAGNCSPVATTLGEIECNQAWDFGNAQAVGFQPGTDSIQFFNKEGKLGNVLSYACTDYIQNNCYDYDHEGGWFDSDAIMNWDFTAPFGSLDIAAGEAFLVKAGDGAGVLPTITIPSPIAEEK